MGGQITQQGAVQLYLTLLIINAVEYVDELLAIKLQVEMPLTNLKNFKIIMVKI